MVANENSDMHIYPVAAKFGSPRQIATYKFNLLRRLLGLSQKIATHKISFSGDFRVATENGDIQILLFIGVPTENSDIQI